MSIFSLLANSLRAQGKEEDAADVERGGGGGGSKKKEYQLPDESSKTDYTMPAGMIAHGADFQRSHGGGGGERSAGGGGAGGGAGAAGGAEHGGGGGGGSEHGGGGRSGGGGGGESSEKGKEEATQKNILELPKNVFLGDEKGKSLGDDPLSGLYSEKLKDRLIKEAGAGASDSAKDSEITRLANLQKIFGEENFAKFKNPLANMVQDSSPAAQAQRIANLNGAIPAFAKGNPELDPLMIRARESKLAEHTTAQTHTATPALAASSSIPRAAPVGDRER